MAAPSDSSATGSPGKPATAASKDSQPSGGASGPVISRRSSCGHFAAACSATSRLAAELNSSREHEFVMMYATSSGAR